MMEAVIGGADADQVAGVVTAVVLAMLEVVDLQPAGLGAPRHPALAVPGQHQAPGPFRHSGLGSADTDR